MSDIKDKRLGCFYSGLSETEYFYDGTFYVGLCSKGFPYCLPTQDDLEAVYLGNILPSSAGVVYDESGKGNDAQLVNSYAVQGDGVVYASGNTDILHDGTNFTGGMIWFNKGLTGSLGGKWLPAGAKKEFTFYKTASTNLRLFYSGNGTNEAFLDFTVPLGWNSLMYEFDNGELSYTLNGVTTSTTLTYASINTSELVALALLSQTNGLFPLNANLAFFKYGNAEFNLCNGGLIEAIPNTGTAGGDATLFNATYPTLWTTQDIFHYNFLNGFDLYENGTAEEEIRVPIGHTFAQSGYTLTSSNVAGVWVNGPGLETEINLPDTLKAVVDLDITDPLSYDDFQTFYGDSAMSNTEENKKKKLVFYDRDLTDAEKITIQKCIDAKTGIDVLNDVNGPVYSPNGLLVLIP